MPDLTTALEFAKTFGFSALCLAVVVYLLSKAAVAFWRDMAIPFRDRAFQHMDRIEDCMDGVKRVEANQASICRLPLAARDVGPEQLPLRPAAT